MFVWYKRSGQPARSRLFLWPLVLCLVVSVVLTLLLNLAL